MTRPPAAVLATDREIIELSQDREELLVAVVRSLVNALDAMHCCTCGHSDRVAKFARFTTRTKGLSEIECDQIQMAGLFHDIVKAGISRQHAQQARTVDDCGTKNDPAPSGHRLVNSETPDQF